MEEELNNVSVSLKTEENEQKTPLHTRLQLAAAALGIICVVLVSVVISLGRHITTVMSEQRRDNISLTVDHLLLWKEKTDFERLTEKLARQRDGLNWTIGVIMEYESFPVHTHCPQKGTGWQNLATDSLVLSVCHVQIRGPTGTNRAAICRTSGSVKQEP
ncbi:hypothetical protein F2P81_002585 [Scophthalmus maximus]|uniref:Uncharacterized protein n=1 Tax=Scophthalmus maximus TaxID=52904 RepID=A0A6A4TES2_SCOMX|nr:hypothetical protein F2P81_002585 [Scophthalmus maximus]